MEHVSDRRTLFVFRHGQTDWNREGRLQGHIDTPLNATGLAQAEALADRLRVHRLDAVVSSDLARALTTGRIIAEVLGVPLVTDHGLRETSVGAAEGLLWEDAKTRFGAELTERWYSDNDAAFPGGETGLATLTRGLAALRRFAVSLSIPADRSVDPWCHGPPIGQARIAARQRAGQSRERGAVRPRIRAGGRPARHRRGRLSVARRRGRSRGIRARWVAQKRYIRNLRSA